MSTSAQKRDRSPHQSTGGRWIGKERRLAIYKRDGYRCLYCGADLRQPGPHRTLDHLRPVSQGGTHDSQNLASCCQTCNTFRGDMPWHDFATRYGTPGAVQRVIRAIHYPLGLIKADIQAMKLAAHEARVAGAMK